MVHAADTWVGEVAAHLKQTLWAAIKAQVSAHIIES